LNGSKEFCQEFMTDVRVPDTDRIGEVDEGWTVGTRWMFHERMLGNSPLVTVPAGSARGGEAMSVFAVARAAGQLDDPCIRDLVGQARMLRVVDRELKRRIGEGIAARAISDQASAIGRLFAGFVSSRTATLAFEVAGAAGAAWTEDDGTVADRGTDFLMRQTSCIGGGTTEMARNVVSERVLGMPRERTLDRDVPFRDVPRSASPRS
jgi:alkylation response protein AidB-like acyl-CoA dehydrogenase